MSKQGAWIAFWVLGVIWGSSFLLIRVGVAEFSPFQLVFIRTGIAAVGMTAVLAVQRRGIWQYRAMILPFIILGLGNTSIPFALITWGEQYISSALASVLQATATLFTLVIAHFAFSDERITPRKAAGLLIGFVGAAVLAFGTGGGGTDAGTLAIVGALGVVLASLFYAIFTVYSRRIIKQQIPPLVVSTGAMTFAAISSGAAMVIAPLLGGAAPVALDAVTSDSLIAVLILGAVNTFIAYVLFYSVVQVLGAARASMVTYIVPVVGVVLGALVLRETITASMIVGALLILSGIATVNVRLPGRRTAAQAPVAGD